jgi:hypothetical protein
MVRRGGMGPSLRLFLLEHRSILLRLLANLERIMEGERRKVWENADGEKGRKIGREEREKGGSEEKWNSKGGRDEERKG